VRTLQRTSWWESPAWSTVTLVFDSSDGAIGDPVDFLLVGGLECFRLSIEVLILDVTKNGFFLNGWPVWKLIMTNLEVWVSSIVLLNPVVHKREVLETLIELLNVSDLAIEFGHMADVVERLHIWKIIIIINTTKPKGYKDRLKELYWIKNAVQKTQTLIYESLTLEATLVEQRHSWNKRLLVDNETRVAGLYFECSEIEELELHIKLVKP